SSTIFAVGGSNDAAFDALLLPTVKVTLETSATALVIDQGLATTATATVNGQSIPITTYVQQPSTIVAGQTTYTYNLSLNQQPAPGQTVTVTLAGLSSTPGASSPTTSLPADIVLSGAGVVNNGNGTYSVTFDSNDWDTPKAITVSATPNATPQAEQNVDIVSWVSANTAGAPYTTTAPKGRAVTLELA